MSRAGRGRNGGQRASEPPIGWCGLGSADPYTARRWRAGLGDRAGFCNRPLFWLGKPYAIDPRNVEPLRRQVVPISTGGVCHTSHSCGTLAVMPAKSSMTALAAVLIAVWSDDATADQRRLASLMPPVTPACVSSSFGPRILPNLPAAGTYHYGIDLPAAVGRIGIRGCGGHRHPGSAQGSGRAGDAGPA